MTKTEIVKALEKETNGQAFITASQLTKLLGRTDSGKVKNSILTNLEAVNGKQGDKKTRVKREERRGRTGQ